ncbi:MAG: hypothetical protein L0312_34175 [Acidobacteria bacterium]|nr:hypothetical protein [Acidobacteriota bacterium]
MAIERNLSDKELWIGLAEVEQTSRNGVLGDVRGGFTNAIAMANGKANFRAIVKRGLDDLGLRLIHLKEAETLKTRLSKHSISEDLERTADEVRSSGEVGFGTFHTFDAE